MSIGLGPEGNHTWEPGHYRFTADQKKCRYNSASPPKPAYEAYGTSGFLQGFTIGCGWIAESKSIYFTINGVSQGVAFSNVAITEKTRLVPSVGVRNVRVRVNFGQEQYLYQVPGWPSTSFKDPETVAKAKSVPLGPVAVKKTQAQIDQGKIT